MTRSLRQRCVLRVPLDPEILDDGVGEELSAHRLDLLVADLVLQVELDQLAGADVVDSGEAEASRAWWMALPAGRARRSSR